MPNLNLHETFLTHLCCQSISLILRERGNYYYLYIQNSDLSHMLLFFNTNPVALHLPIVKFETLFTTG